MSRVDYDKLSDARASEPSATIRGRVQAARNRQARRFTGTTLTCNADMDVATCACIVRSTPPDGA